MKTLQVIIHCLPREIDQLERVLDKLHEGAGLLESSHRVILDVTLNLNDTFTDWNTSTLDQKFFTNKFEIIKAKNDWTYKNLFEVDTENKCLGINDKRRNSIREAEEEVTHFMYLDLDLHFSSLNLGYLFLALDQITNKYQIVSSQLTKLWDSSWDVLCNSQFINQSYEFYKELDPYLMESYSQQSQVEIRPIQGVKFGGGWFNAFSKNLLQEIDIPDSLGPYGQDDTFVMMGANIMQQKGYDIKQYVLDGMIVCENIKHSIYKYNPYENYIEDLSFEDKGRKYKHAYKANATKNFDLELQKFYTRLNKEVL